VAKGARSQRLPEDGRLGRSQTWLES
jgi:hypothetical protein